MLVVASGLPREAVCAVLTYEQLPLLGSALIKQSQVSGRTLKEGLDFAPISLCSSSLV